SLIRSAWSHPLMSPVVPPSLPPSPPPSPEAANSSHLSPSKPTARMLRYSECSEMDSDWGEPWAGVPAWAVWSFIACGIVIVAVLALDYCVIRRNALGNTCCTRSKQKSRAAANQSSLQQAAHQKRSTNMLLNKMSRNVQLEPQDIY
ncbi:hypothetical protein PFISCL1PPCAC_27424, partial [Pristionchus fissidentatus]